MMYDFDDIELVDLLEFLEKGFSKNVPPKILAYMQMLDKVWGMYRRQFDFPNFEAIITHLVHVDKLQRHTARKVVKDAMDYFAQENNLPKNTWRFLIADLMKKEAMFSIQTQRNPKDAKYTSDILMNLYKVLELDKEDISEMEEDLMKQIQILTTDITMFGEERVSRNELAELIDALPDVPEKIKEASKIEVDQFPFRFLKSGENPRSND